MGDFPPLKMEIFDLLETTIFYRCVAVKVLLVSGRGGNVWRKTPMKSQVSKYVLVLEAFFPIAAALLALLF